MLGKAGIEVFLPAILRKTIKKNGLNTMKS